MDQNSLFGEAADLLERAALQRYGSMRAFQRATGVRHSLFGAMRHGGLPGLETLTAVCHGLGVTLASVLAVCWRLDLNTLPSLHLKSTTAGTLLLPSSPADTGIRVPFPARLSYAAVPNTIRLMSDIVEKVDEQPLAAIAQIGNSRLRVLRLGDWSLFPLFQPGDILFVEPKAHNTAELSSVLRVPRPIVIVNHGYRYALGHLVQGGSQNPTALDPHPESGHPSVSLTQDWSLIGTVRGFCAPLLHRATRPKPWRSEMVGRSRIRVPAKSRFGAMCRTARLRLGLSVEGVVESIRRLAPSFPAPATLFSLSKSRVGTIESGADDAQLNIFGLFALLAVYGLDYRDALDALGFPIEETGAIPIQQLFRTGAGSGPIQIAHHEWIRSIVETWGSIPWQTFPMYPGWSKDRIVYHGAPLAHPMIRSRCFLRVGKWRDLPRQPLRAGQQSLSWPLFAFQTREGIVCMNAYRDGRHVRSVQHPQRAQNATSFDLGRDADFIGRVTDVAAMLPTMFGWD